MAKILVTGAFGLVGSELIEELKKRYGQENVIAMGHSKLADYKGVVEQGDVRDKTVLENLIKKHGISTVYHLAGLLSVGGEKNPKLAWDVNINGLKNILDLAVEHKFKIFWPSSIAAFGPTTPRENTPQHTILEPTTIYGVTKVAGELLGQYYNKRWDVDFRSLRYPGLNGWKAEPGDGTTEYAIHIFYGAVRDNHYVCPLKPDAVLPMMYLDDAIKGTVDLMEVPGEKITVRTSYNFAAISFAPQELVTEIKKLSAGFSCKYKPDERQAIAESWPKTIDDSQARKDWDWKPEYDLPKMVEALYTNIKRKVIEQA